MPAAKLIGNNGIIISVEPNKENFLILKHNIELNKLKMWYLLIELFIINRMKI